MKILLKTEIFIRKWFQTIEFMNKYLLGFFIDGAAPENDLGCLFLQVNFCFIGTQFCFPP